MAAPPFIQFQNVTKSYGKHLVLNDITVDIPFKEITGIIGSSGSGKTTLLNLLIGFIRTNSGKILFQSRELKKDIKNISTIFGFATQAGSFYGNLTIQENFYYFGSLYDLHKKDIEGRMNELLNLLELDYAKNVLAKDLSTGMQRRLDISLALIHNPKVLIMDEPTEDLDPILRKELVKIIRKIRDDGTTIIITSHLLNEIENLCDNIAILSDGRIIEFDSPTKLKDKYKKQSLDEVFEVVVQKFHKEEGIDPKKHDMPTYQIPFWWEKEEKKK